MLRWPATRTNKFGARTCAIDGHVFASQREATRYRELRYRERAGEIQSLELQPEFPIWVLAPNGECITVARYRADFRYAEAGQVVVEDVKSPATRRLEGYRLRKKLTEAIHGIEVREV